MWVFESVSGHKGRGDDPVEAVIDCLGENVEFEAQEVTSDEEEIVVTDPGGGILGWARYEE